MAEDIHDPRHVLLTGAIFGALQNSAIADVGEVELIRIIDEDNRDNSIVTNEIQIRFLGLLFSVRIDVLE